MQIADTLLPVFDAPSWVMKVLVGLLVLGMLPALIFSRVYELTAEGLKRDAEVDPAQSISAHTARRLDRLTLAAVAVLKRWEALGGRDGVWNAIPLARQACAEGRRGDVEALLTRVPPDDLAQRWHLLHLLGNDAEAEELLRGLECAGNTFALANFMTYPDFDPRPFPSLMAVLEREKVQRTPPVPLPFACPPAELAR